MEEITWENGLKMLQKKQEDDWENPNFRNIYKTGYTLIIGGK